jgi:catechol 2,3-dioxygenase-like lactoylglutathione lyase family enzyme
MVAAVGDRRRPGPQEAAMDCKLELIALPVTDVDRAIGFYVDQLGWHLDHDHTVTDDLRFVQVTPPGSACSIAIGKGLIQGQQGPIRTLQVVVPDIGVAHAELTAAGVAASPIDDQPWGSFVHFEDPDGNAWAVQQVTPRGA